MKLTKRFEAFSFYLALVPAILLLLMMIVRSAAVKELAVSGIKICIGTIIPSLFPFFIASNLLSNLGFAQIIGSLTAPFVRRVFKADPCTAAPLAIGLTGGYPLGAASVAQLYKNGDLTKDEAERALAFCNNTGPAFIIGAAGSGIFSSSKCGALLYISHAAAAVAVGFLFSLKAPVPEKSSHNFTHSAAVSLPHALINSVTAALRSTAAVCGYVLFFTVLTGMLKNSGFIYGILGELSYHSRLSLSQLSALFTGLIEIGSGLGCMQGFACTSLNMALCSFILSFGGLSVHFQTMAVVSGTDLKCARHFAGRILHAFISAAITYLAAGIFL